MESTIVAPNSCPFAVAEPKLSTVERCSKISSKTIEHKLIYGLALGLGPNPVRPCLSAIVSAHHCRLTRHVAAHHSHKSPGCHHLVLSSSRIDLAPSHLGITVEVWVSTD
jgi:hypothetical protein